MQMIASCWAMMQSSKKANLMTGAVVGTDPLEPEGSVFRVLGPSHMNSCLSPVGRDSSTPQWASVTHTVDRDVTTVVNSQRLNMKQVY